jgi:hypothetical protein
MNVKEARGLIRQIFSRVEPSYIKIWRGIVQTIVDIFIVRRNPTNCFYLC